MSNLTNKKVLTAEEGIVASFEEMRPSFYISATLHFIVLLLIIFGLPLLPKKKIEMPEPISVEMVNPSDLARTTHVDEPTPKPEDAKPAQPPPEPPKPPPPPSTPPPTPPQPPAPVEQVPEIKPLQEQLAPIPQLNALPEIAKPMQIVKPQPAPPKPLPQLPPIDQKKAQVQDQQFNTLLKNLSKPVPPPQPQQQPNQQVAKQVARPPAARATLSDVLTADELALVRERLKACWIVPAGAYNAENLAIDIQAEFNPDATLKSETLVDSNDRYNRDPYYKAAADSALRALRNPACDPLPLPTGKYNEWSSMSFRFDPKEMLAP